MASKKIKGITVQIGGNTSGLTKALSDADKALKETQGELNAVQKGLKFDPSNGKLIVQQQTLLTQAVEQTAAKLRMLEEAQDKVNKAHNANKAWEAQYAPIKQRIEETSEALKKLKSQEESLKKEHEEGKISDEDYKKFRDTLKAAEAAAKEARAEKKKLDEQFEDGHIDDKQYREYEREVEKTRAELKKLEDQLKDSGKASENASSDMDKASKSAEKLGDNAEDSGKKLEDFTGNAKKHAADLVKAFAAVAAALIAVGKSSVDAGMEFDSSVSQIGATMGFTADELADKGSEASQTMAELRDFAKQMGADTAFNASEAANALNYMALAGYDADKSMEMLPKVLNLAAAGGIELAEASDMVTDAQSALGLSIDETSALVDKMAKTASKTNTSVGQLGEGILKIGGTAKSLKGGTTELAASLGVLADNGIKGAEGGTHLRNVLLSLQKAAVDGKIAVGDMTVAVYDANGEMRALPDIFGDINTAMQGMTDASADVAKSAIFNKTDLSAVNALLSTSSDRWASLTGEIDSAAGAAQAMAETQLDNLAGDLTLMQSAVEGAKIAVSDRLTPSLRKAAQLGTKLISAMSEEFGENGLSGAVTAAHRVIEDELGAAAKTVYGIEAATKAAAAAFVVYKSGMVLTNVIGSLQTVNNLMREGKTLAEAMNAAQMANPYVLIATAALAAGVAVKSLIDTQTDLIQETADSYDLLNEKQKAAVDGVSGLAQSISDSKAKYSESADAIETQAEAAEKMLEKLYALDDEEQLSAEQKAEMAAIVESLNSSYEGLNIQLDTETGHLATEKKAIEDSISAMKKKAKAAAAEEMLTELYKEQVQAEKNLANVTDERTAARQKLNDLNEEYASSSQELLELEKQASAGYATPEMLDRIAELTNKVGSLNGEITAQKDIVGALDGAYVSASESVNGIKDNIDTATAAITDNGGQVTDSAEQISESLNNVADSADDAAGKTSQVFTITEEQVEDTLGKVDELVKGYNDKVSNLSGDTESFFTSGTIISDLDLENLNDAQQKMLNSLYDTRDNVNTYFKNLDILAGRGLNEGLLQKLKDAGPTAYKDVAVLVSMTDDQLKEYDKVWEDTYTSIPKLAEKQYDELKATTNKKIQELVKEIESQCPDIKNVFGRLGMFGADGYIEAFNDPDKRAELEAAIRSFVQLAEATIEDEAEINSPSKVFRRLGDYTGEGYALGISDEAKAAAEASKRLVSAAVAASSGVSLKVPAVELARGVQQALPQTAQSGTDDSAAELLKAMASATTVQRIVIGEDGRDVIAESITPKIDVLLARNITQYLGGR